MNEKDPHAQADRLQADRLLADRLLAEQLGRAVDLMNGRFDALEAMVSHLEALTDLRLSALERAQAGQETRLRAAESSVVRLSALTSLAQAGQAAFSLALSTVAAWLGSK